MGSDFPKFILLAFFIIGHCEFNLVLVGLLLLKFLSSLLNEA